MDKSRHTIAGMFNRIAARYDLLNRVLSMGLDIRWRHNMFRLFPAKRPLRVLDMATGTADVPLMMVDQLGKDVFTHIVGGDISDQMLEVGRHKVNARGLDGLIRLENADATQLEFLDDSFDVVTIAFGIRNVAHVDKALAEFFRVLSPGGRVLILEFSMPQNAVIRWGYLMYFRHVLPWVGGLISKDQDAYRYLNRSVEGFHDRGDFAQLMSDAGFDQVHWESYCFGVASVYVGDKN